MFFSVGHDRYVREQLSRPSEMYRYSLELGSSQKVCLGAAVPAISHRARSGAAAH